MGLARRARSQQGGFGRNRWPEVTSQRGKGQLTGTTTIQRINTKGGTAEGACDTSGAFQSVPYSADYTFLTKGG